MPHTGHCLCGQVTYTIDAEPSACRLCWCRDCQYIASGSATVNVLFPEEAVRYSGDITTIVKTADSGNTVEPKGMPIRVRAGTLDDRELMAPSAIIWAASAPAWAVLDPELPHHSQGPDSALIETRS